MSRGNSLRTLVFVVLMLAASRIQAQERLCDPAFEDCRLPLWQLIDAETVGIDVAFWFMQDSSYATKLINRFKAGVPVRVLVDPRANPTYAGNDAVLEQLKAAGIPMRYKAADGILHWKMMLFAGQGKLEFSGANYSGNFFVPDAPNSNYFDEAIYFTNDPSLIQSFKTKYDDVWTNTVQYANFANINGPLTRKYPTTAISPELNFPPSVDSSQDFFIRTQQNMNAETKKIDIIMYRITSQAYTDTTIAAVKRGVPVRLIHEPDEYRNVERQWDAWNVDRLFMAGVQIKMRKHLGLNHQKSVLLYGRGMTIFGSSNWTTPSSNSQLEHNYFTTKSSFFQWFVDQFERKWNSTAENQPFAPLPPNQPTNLLPLNAATGQPTTMTLQWEGGPWAHKYDIYFGTTSNPPLLVANASTFQSGAQTGDPLLQTGSVDEGVKESYKIPTALQVGTTYFWRVVGKTMANQTANGPTWSFTTQGVATPTPTPTPTPAPAPVLINDSVATTRGLALHSPLFTREPFSLTTLLNMSADQRTRVMLFANNVDPNTRNTWTVTGVSTTGAQYQLPVEYAGKGPGADSITSFIVILPQDPNLHGDLTVRLIVAGVQSNPIKFAIR
ncbi:MAG TPA: phospholipase D-like domain-containing protein [Pyrinomonadaceae bacterium]|nr:phospholipase D-like domain-containing protein [Pyrinomonadaceae bacterium]